MTISRLRITTGCAAILFAVLAAIAPVANAKTAAIDGRLLSDVAKIGSKVEAPILLSNKSAKKLGLSSPLAVITLNASKSLSAPSPTGAGQTSVLPTALRSGDRLVGKASVKRKAKGLMPTLKAKKVRVTDRESAYSVDELTGFVATMYGQISALGLRVDTLEGTMATFQAQLTELAAQNAGLAGQVNSILGQLTSLTTNLQSLTSLVNGLPTAEDLANLLSQLTGLQTDLTDLEGLVGSLGTTVTGLQGQITSLTGQLGSLAGSLTGLLALCEPPSLVAAIC